MSKMSNPRLSPKKRLEILKRELPMGTPKGKIAELCSVRPETISRDMRAWRASGAFEDWLMEEFFRLHNEVKEGEPSQAYRIIARLLERTLTQKVEAKHTSAGIIVKIDAGMEPP